MRWLGMLVWFPILLAAQSAPPAALVRGALLERDPQTANGQFSIRVGDDHVYRYLFDAKTYVERDQRAIDVARLQPGETVEVLSDEAPGTVLRYALSVHVLSHSQPERARPLARLRPARASIERIFPAATLSFSGVVFELSPQRVMIHTRESGDLTILLRGDTSYLENGDAVQSGDLKPNMRVYVRAERNLYNEIEAYQVIWGQILTPH